LYSTCEDDEHHGERENNTQEAKSQEIPQARAGQALPRPVRCHNGHFQILVVQALMHFSVLCWRMDEFNSLAGDLVPAWPILNHEIPRKRRISIWCSNQKTTVSSWALAALAVGRRQPVGSKELALPAP
jgi:hypothetical protein